LDTRFGQEDAGSARIGLKSCRRHVDLPREHLREREKEREKRTEEGEDDPATAILALCRTSGVELWRWPGMEPQRRSSEALWNGTA
jgi:hypothetical protein